MTNDQTPAAASMARQAFVAMGASGPRTIISVYPLPLELSLMHEGTKIYRIDAAPKDGYSKLVVLDTFATCKNFSSGALYPAPVPASVVADNLIQAWTKGRVGTSQDSQLGPGILICAGPEPTEAEVASAKELQTAYFRKLVNDADASFSKEGSLNISDDHRMAAEWMGTKDRKWAQPITPAETKRCPACAEEIKAAALICRFCNTNIRKFLEEEAKASSKPKAS